MSGNTIRNPEEVGLAFRQGMKAFHPNRRLLILGHFDADGLSAAAILSQALARAGHPSDIRIMGKGEHPWVPSFRRELEERNPGGLVVTDLGVRDGDILPEMPTIIVDHHVPAGVPGDAVVISGNGWMPEPTSSLLAYWCAEALGDAHDLLWLRALGLIGDMASEDFSELAVAQAQYGKTALRDAVSLINAPRRTGNADASPALALLLRCTSPKDLLKGGHAETGILLAAKAEVAAALDSVKRVPPKIRGNIALIRFASPCQVHPLVAQAWRSRLKDKIVLVVNTGYRPGWIHFAARTATDTDLIQFLAEHRPQGAGGEYGSGHIKATGGALRPSDWNDFATRIGFPEEKVSE